MGALKAETVFKTMLEELAENMEEPGTPSEDKEP
jgi:hypothetical protein